MKAISQREPPLIASGTQVDHFKVMRLLGQGGMAQVYLARDTKLGRKVALKVIRPIALGSPDSIARFLFEARATARFNHPHIVTIFAVGEYDGRPYVALEYLEGQNLKERLEEGTPSVREALRITTAIAEALAEAHRSQILHRDLKPENVVIPRDGRLRVVDFGLAKSLDTTSVPSWSEGGAPLQALDDLELTATQDVFETNDRGLRGTPQYMSPEQWMGEECSAATDVWALGLICYEMLAGRLPYASTTAMSLAVRVCDPEPVPDLKSMAEVSEEVSELTARCLRKDPSERPAIDELVELLEEMLERRPQKVSTTRSPFRGLLPFSERHADFFFGRDSEINAFLERLREEPTIPVVGPSGAGKSSFVQAGVIPRLREQGRWLVLRLRPGSHPLRGLSAKLKFGESTIQDRTVTPLPPPLTNRDSELRLERREEEEEGLRELLLSSPTMLNLHLQRLATQNGSKVLLFVDQLEELYTLVDDDDIRQAFMRALCTAADDPQEPVRVIFTLRDDFLGRLAEGPEAREVLSHVAVIRSPGRTALEAILHKPLAAVGYGYEQPSLVTEMVEAVGGEAACLPLLQFVTRTLWDRRDRQRQLLLREVYDEVGGVAGALAYHADSVLDGMTSEQVTLTRQLLLKLVTPESTRRSVARSEVLASLGDEAGDLLDRLIRARLISIRKTLGEESAEAVLELAHESLIRKWARLSRWVDESREELSFLAELEQAAELWQRRGRREDELWTSDALREARRNLKAVATRASDKVVQFLEAGTERQERAARRTRRRRMLWSAGLVAITCVAVAVAFAFANQNRRLDEQRQQERQRRAEIEREGARSAIERGAFLEARSRLRAALEVHDSPLGRALWWRLTKEPRLWRKRLPSSAYDVSFSPDKRTVAVAAQDKAIHLFDVTTGSPIRTLRGHRDQVFSVAFSPDGQKLASGTWSGNIRLWDIKRGRAQTFKSETHQVWRLAFSPNGKILASSGTEKVIHLWDVTTLERLTSLEGHEVQVSGLRFSPNGKTLVSGDSNGGLLIWKAPWTLPPRKLRAPAVQALDLSPDGKQLVIATFDRSLRLFDIEAERTVESLATLDEPVSTVAFSPDGRLIAAAGFNGNVAVWDLEERRRLSELEGHQEWVLSLAFSPDSRQLVSVSYDGEIMLWDATMPHQQSPSSGHTGTTWVTAFDPRGHRLASGGEDGTIRIWDIESGRIERVLEGHSSGVSALSYGPGGELLASGSHDMMIRIWDTETGTENRVFAAHDGSVTSVVFGDGDRTLISSSADHTIVVWDLALRIPLKIMANHDAGVQRVVLSPDGTRIGSASHDGTVRTWELLTGLQDKVFREHIAPVWGVDSMDEGRTLVSAGEDGTIRSWDVVDESSRVIGRHPGRVYWVSTHPEKRQIATAGSDGQARLWDPETGELIVIEGHRAEVNSITYSADGAMVATTSDDGTVRLWQSASGFPVWRCPLLMQSSKTSPPSFQLLTHRGWSSLEAGVVKTRDAETAWEGRLEEVARTAALSRSGGTLCVRTHEDQLELWDVVGDKRLSSAPLKRFRAVRALEGGCVTLANRAVRFHPRQGSKVRELRGGRVSAIAVDEQADDEVLLASEGHVLVLSTEGEERERYDTGPRARAMLRTDLWLVVGFENGSLELFPRSEGGRRPVFSFQETPSSPVASLLIGPSDTLVAGFANGLLGLWDLNSGCSLWQGQLHGSVVHLSRSGPELFAATDLGDFRTVDLSTFEVDECELLEQVWQRAPFVWRGSAPVPSDPPTDHPRCSRAVNE